MMTEEWEKTKNTLVITGPQNPATVFQVRLIENFYSYRVSYVTLRIAAASAIRPTLLAGMNLVILSNTFASKSNNQNSFFNGWDKNIIASFPIHQADVSNALNPAFETWKFTLRLGWTKVKLTDINLYDVSITVDGVNVLPFTGGDNFSVCLEIKNYSKYG